MPAVSKAQRRAMAIAEHHPEKLYKRNRGMLSMGKAEMHKFATTKETGLPKRRKRKRSPAMIDRAVRKGRNFSV